MKPWGGILWAVLIAAASTAEARLGETAADISQRYGSPATPPFAVDYAHRDYGDQQARYAKDGLVIVVIFRDNRSQYETLSRAEPHARLSRTEVKAFIEANAAGSTWPEPKTIPGGTAWERTDGGAHALLTPDGKTLTVRVTRGGSKGF